MRIHGIVAAALCTLCGAVPVLAEETENVASQVLAEETEYTDVQSMIFSRVPRP